MINGVMEFIHQTPVWSFSREVELESGQYMELSLNCTIQAEVVDDQLVLLVTPIDNLPDDINVGWEKRIKQEIWNKFRIIPSVVFFHPSRGFF